MRRTLSALMVGCLAVLIGAPAAFAQGSPTTVPVQGLTLFTRFPAQEVALGDAITFPLVLRTNSAEIAKLSVRDLPKGWAATMRGDGKIIQAAYVNPGEDTKVDLRLDPPKDVAAGTFNMSVAASGGSEVMLPLTVVIEQKLPPSLEFSADLPTIRNAPGSTFTFNTTLKNAGDTDLTVNLVAQAPNGFDVKFSTAGQDVTSLPVEANTTKNISVAVSTPSDAQAGSAPISVKAEGGDISAELALTAELVGQSKVELSTPDGRLSGDAYVGASTPFKLVVRNTGSAPTKNITVSASPPAGWKVDFSPPQIDVIAPGQQVEVTAGVHPSDQAVAGDYVIGFSARPAEGSASSSDFRVTVLTSTLWGIIGIGLIAVAVAVVGLAVTRFGRR